MVARSVSQLVRVVVGEAAQHEDVVAQRLQRLEDARERECAAVGGGRPVRHDDAVRHVRERQAHRRAPVDAARAKAGRIASRKGRAMVAPRAAQERAAREVPPEDRVHDAPPSPFRMRKGRLCAISMTRAENR